MPGPAPKGRILALATRNPGKIVEIRRLLAGQPFEIRDLSGFDSNFELREDGTTFLANARQKAWAVADAFGHLALADDSGLEVDALDGRPGVYSARYASGGLRACKDEENNSKLLRDLSGVPVGKRQARYRCVLVVADPGNGREWVFSGACEGAILHAPRGMGGFGYDPLFFVPENGRSMAEIPLDEKNRLSHRGRALQDLLACCHEFLRP